MPLARNMSVCFIISCMTVTDYFVCGHWILECPAPSPCCSRIIGRSYKTTLHVLQARNIKEILHMADTTESFI